MKIRSGGVGSLLTIALTVGIVFCAVKADRTQFDAAEGRATIRLDQARPEAAALWLSVMTWGKLCDTFHSHPKIAEAGNAAAGLFARLISWSNHHLTDGRVPRGIIAMYSSGDDSQIGALIAQRLLEPDPGGDGFLIHDFLDHNDDAETVRGRNADLSAKRSAAGKKGAARRWQNGKRDSKSHGKTMAKVPEPEPRGNRPRSPISGQPENAHLHGKNGKPIANAMAKRWQNDGPGPGPGPIERDRATADFESSTPFNMCDVEKIGFSRWGQLGGSAQAEISRLCPIYGHEIKSALSTEGDSWKYAAKVIRSYRKAMARDAEPPGSPDARPSGAFGRTTKKLMEWANEPTDPNHKKPVFGPNGALAGLLSGENF